MPKPHLSSLELLQRVHDDVSLARLFRTGVASVQVPSFKVATLRTWLDGMNRQQFYGTFTLSKRSGGDRIIRAPFYELKTAQRVLNLIFNDVYRPRRATHGYVKGQKRGIISNARTHERQRWVLRVDLEDFFSYVHIGRVRGLMLKAPFSLSGDVADMVAKLCTYPIKPRESVLPQGAPTSPILTNFICSALDRDLMELAKRYRCHYSRYADDLVFSTDRNSFPADLAHRDGAEFTVGQVLRDIIAGHGFCVNPEKTSLRRNSSRQLVTGLVVNEKANVPRHKVMELKAMLHSWETQGLEVASQRFRERYDAKNRPPGLTKPDFKRVVRGRVLFIGAVKGLSDPIYTKFAEKLSELDEDFAFDPKGQRIEPTTMVVFTEGKTDRKHIAAALKHLQAVGKYETLKIELHEPTNISNDEQLLKACESLQEREQSLLSVFVFDRDNPSILKKVQGSNGSFKDWGNRVVSLPIPIPDHRHKDDPICIEHYYTDRDLKQEDVNKRRIYLKSEFDPNTGKHAERDIYRINPKVKTLIVDGGVFSFRREGNIALSKNDFAQAVEAGERPFHNVDFSGFAVLFDRLVEIAERYQ